MDKICRAFLMRSLTAVAGRLVEPDDGSERVGGHSDLTAAKSTTGY
jgi:hypothetical protein